MLRVAVVAACLLLISLAGCTKSEDPGNPESPAVVPADPADPRIECRVTDTAGLPIANASCKFSWNETVQELAVDGDGVAAARVPVGASLTILASAAGHVPRIHDLAVATPVRITLALEVGDENAKPVTTKPAAKPQENGTQGAPIRAWRAPMNIEHTGSEPHIVISPVTGTIFYAPTANPDDGLLRSRDGGLTWVDVEPSVEEALPDIGGDTAVQVAPDGSVWYARYWAYPGPTVGCTSLDEGDSWVCDNLAIPPVTDRMWIAGIDASFGYLQTNLGTSVNTYAYTDTGSLRYVPYATSDQINNVRNGNMVYDPVSQKVYQLMGYDNLLLVTLDGLQPGVIPTYDTGVPVPGALPWLSITDGVFWTTGGPILSDASRSLVLARSVDQGQSWDQLPIESQALSITFSFVASGPDGRVAAVYYGSDQPGDPATANEGTWSLYVVETDNGNDPVPVWTETLLVEGIHVGNVCLGLACEADGADPTARFSGDLIGAAIDAEGNVHIAYNDDTNPGPLNRYIRQDRASA